MQDAIRDVDKQVKLPEGYTISWAGEYASQQRSQRRLMLASIAMAPLGGLLALLVTGTHFSVSSGVGFLALFGVCVETGVIMLEYINQPRARGHSIMDAAVEGAVFRLRPIMMTTLVATLACFPRLCRAPSVPIRSAPSPSLS